MLALAVLISLLAAAAATSIPARASEPPEAAPPRDVDAPLQAPKRRPSITTSAAPASTAVTIGGPWQAQGPLVITNGQVENVPGNDPVNGSLHSLAAHPTNADILFIGTSNGGIWRSTNATAANPSWTPLTDQFPSLSIGEVAFDPTDATGQTLLAGIGGFSNFGVDGALTGVLRSTDGGNTWTQLGQAQLAGRTVWAVAARGATLFAATNAGLFRSTDTGGSFQNVSGLNGLNTGIVFDLARDPSDNQRLYAAVGGNSGGVFRTDDGGANWTNVTSAAVDAQVSGATSNMEISVSAAAGNAVFLGIVNNGRLAAMFRSANQGGAWTAMDLPRTQEGTLAIGIHPGGQGGNNFSLTADPTDGDIVYVGGDRQPANPGPNNIEGDNDDSWPNSIGARDYTGRLFRGDASVAPTGAVPSPQWTALTHNGTAGNSAPHADSRDLVFDANGRLIEADDAGIYERTAPRTNTGNWLSMIGNLQAAQFHDIAYDDNFNVIVGGTQDTGTPYQTGANSTNWTSLATADGGDVAIDDRSVAGQSTFYWSTQRLGNFRRRTCTGANVCGANTNIALNVLAGGSPIGRQFVTPIELNSQDMTRLIIGGSNSVYESADQGDNVTELNSPGVTSNGMVYGHASNADLILVGAAGQLFRRTTAGGNLTATAADPPGVGALTDIAIDPDDANFIVVTKLGSVAITRDGGATWEDITGNLATMGGAGFQSVLYVEGTSTDFIVVGDVQGVFAIAAPFCGCWFEVGTGLPNTYAFDLDYDAGDDVLVAGTLGRGAFTFNGLAAIAAPSDAGPTVTLTATGGEVNGACVFEAPYSAVITDDCGLDRDSIAVTAVSLDGLATVGTPTVVVDVVSLTEIRVSGVVPVSDLVGCPARVRITVAADDACDQTGSDSEVIEVEDNTPPEIVVTLNRYDLWPPNHKLATIEAHVVAADNCPLVSWVLKSVTSDEPDDGLGDGHTSPDIVGATTGTQDTVFQLRSERQGTEDGRDYTIVYEATDACGNTAQSVTHVIVPHDQSGHALALAGFEADGRSLDPLARTVSLVVPSVPRAADSAEPGEELWSRNGGKSDWQPLEFDALSIVEERALIGNTSGIVAPSRVLHVDATGDGVRDRILEFPAEPIRELLQERKSPSLGLHYVTEDGGSYLAPDILTLQKAPCSTCLSDLERETPGLDALAAPRTTRFLGAQPSPFAGRTTVRFDLARAARVRLVIHDVLGRAVRTLASGEMSPGSRGITWDGRNDAGGRVNPGVYLLRFEADGVRAQGKVVRMD